MTQADLPEDDRRDDRPSDDRELSSEVTSDDRTMGMLCHLLGALLSWLGPLIIWMIKKDQSRFVDDQGKEALNFQITLLIGHLIGGVTICFTFGVINSVLYVLGIVFGIL